MLTVVKLPGLKISNLL